MLVYHKSIIAISKEAEVTPGIIVGQLQRAGLVDHAKMNFLKRRYRWGNSPNVPELVESSRGNI